jgi:DNA processing protein
MTSHPTSGDLAYRVAWTLVPLIGPARYRMLEQAFPSMEAAWTAPANALRQAGLDERAAQRVAQARAKIDPDAEMRRIESAGGRAITWQDTEYPRLLKDIASPPPVLFVLGAFQQQDERAVTVVGTRRATAYGREAAAQLSRALAEAGCTIISGMARGIDAAAHRAALEAGGRTVAVLGSGLDVIYPPEHRQLAEQIAASGAVITEFPLGTKPDAGNFPRRNRILSGLAQACLVVEAPVDSGAMLTVQYALEQGREVLAVPGSIFSPASQGANRLIQDGAKPVLNAKDVLEELNLFTWAGREPPPPRASAPALEDDETKLLRYIGYEPVHIDDLARRLAMPITSVSSTLALMEIKGLVKPAGGMHFLRAREVPVPYETAEA